MESLFNFDIGLILRKTAKLLLVFKPPQYQHLTIYGQNILLMLEYGKSQTWLILIDF